MIKKSLIINLILIALLYLLPNEKIELKEKTKEIEPIQQVSCRSLIEQRTEEQQEQIATVYSENCINLIKKYEGCKLEAYRLDGEKYYTIGYGYHNSDVKAGQEITEEIAERLLINEVKAINDYIIKQGYEFNQNELDAMISFSYNCGIGNFNKLTKNRTKEEIAEHIESYTNRGMKGLIKRRAEEKELFAKEVV